MSARVAKIRKILIGYQVGDRVRITNCEKSSLWPAYQDKVVTLIKPAHIREGQRCWIVSGLEGKNGFWCQEDCMEPE
jgi:hypothetical protein